jgi:hypothetical protein
MGLDKLGRRCLVSMSHYDSARATTPHRA